MQELTDYNYQEVIEKYFLTGNIVLVGITPTPGCPECIANHETATKFFEKHPTSKLKFCFVDYSKYDILQNYYEIHQMTLYPKMIIFYGCWENKEFMEGRFTLEKLEQIEQKF